jgi:predicted transcriptional regulator of viral defense system
MKAEEFFSKNPVFTLKDFVNFYQTTHNISVDSVIRLIRYHEKVGNLLSIRRGFYAYVPIANRGKDYKVNPYLIAGRITEDSVLAYHTSLELQGVAYSVFHEFYFIVDKVIKPFEFQELRYHPLKKHSNYGIISFNRDGLDIKATTIERTLVDLFSHPSYAGGLSEIWQSFELVSLLDVDKVIEYAFLLNNASTVAKLGFFLEQHLEKFGVSEKHLMLLETKKPKHKLYLERNKRKNGKLIQRWNLVVPPSSLTHEWEDPNEIL